MSPARCLYGDAGCSLTFATYLLCLLTGLAFLAAFRAARWALKTYRVAADALQLEQSRILIETHCRSDHERVHYAHVTLQGGRLQLGRPDDDSEPLFLPMDFQFSSLGRTGIVDPKLTLRVKFGEGQPDVTLPNVLVGSVRPDGTTYARLWLDLNDLDVLISWDASTAKQFTDGQDSDLIFRPLAPRTPPARAIFQLRKSTASAGAAIASRTEVAEEDVESEQATKASMPEAKTPPQAPVPQKGEVVEEKPREPRK